MPARIELTLEDVAKIALGTSELTPMHISVLHSLINVLLRKLDCDQEKVTIKGTEAKCLERVFRSTAPSPYVFNDEKLQQISKQIDRIEKLERYVDSTSEKLEKHFVKIEQTKAIKHEPFDWSNWQHYVIMSSNRCIPCDPENELACSLLNNIDFIKKLQRRIGSRMVDRLYVFESQVENMGKDLIKFLDMVDYQCKQIALIDGCLFHIEKLQDKVRNNHYKFLGTMEEVQELLDSKLDKIHVPALKRFIIRRFERLEGIISKLQTISECPKSSGIITSGVRCLSCGVTDVCAEVGVQTTGMLPDVLLKPYKLLPKYCNCKDRQKVKNTAQSHECRLTYGKDDDDESELKPAKHEVQLNSSKCSNIQPCVTSRAKLKLIEGTNGALYRRD